MIGPSNTFVRKHAAVIAHRFDGTRESALVIAGAFEDRVAHAVEHDDELLALVDGRLQAVPKGFWVVMLVRSGTLELWDDTHFRQSHEA